MKKSIVRIGVTVFAVTAAAFLLAGCEESASPNNDGLVDGFLVRVNEKPGTTTPGAEVYIRNVTVVSAGLGAAGSGNYVVGQTVFIDAGVSPSWEYRFETWTASIANVTFADAKKASTSFIMPTSDVTVSANFLSILGTLGTFTDARDQKIYKTTKLGSQTWMAENLNYKPSSGNSWCYENKDSICNQYGRLYNWETAKAVCPSGWYLPSIEEWVTLEEWVTYAVGTSAGKKLKAAKADGWNGTDEFGFSALPGGFRNAYYGTFNNVGNSGYWWTATEFNNITAYNRRMDSDDSMYKEGVDKNHGFSVRCLQD